MLYDVFDYRLFEKGFKWLDADQLETARLKFEKSLVGLKKEATKRRKVYLADAARLFIVKGSSHSPFFRRNQTTSCTVTPMTYQSLSRKSRRILTCF